MPMNSDNVVHGSPMSFEALCEKVNNLVRSHAATLAREAPAEDIGSDLVMDLMIRREREPEFVAPANLEAWVYGAVRRKIARQVRGDREVPLAALPKDLVRRLEDGEFVESEDTPMSAFSPLDVERPSSLTATLEPGDFDTLEIRAL